MGWGGVEVGGWVGWGGVGGWVGELMLLRGSRWRRCWADAGKSAQPGFLGLDAAARAVHAAKGEEGVHLSCKVSARAARSSTTCTPARSVRVHGRMHSQPHALRTHCTPAHAATCSAGIFDHMHEYIAKHNIVRNPTQLLDIGCSVGEREGGWGRALGLLCHCCAQNHVGKPSAISGHLLLHGCVLSRSWPRACRRLTRRHCHLAHAHPQTHQLPPTPISPHNPRAPQV